MVKISRRHIKLTPGEVDRLILFADDVNPDSVSVELYGNLVAQVDALFERRPNLICDAFAQFKHQDPANVSKFCNRVRTERPLSTSTMSVGLFAVEQFVKRPPMFRVGHAYADPLIDYFEARIAHAPGYAEETLAKADMHPKFAETFTYSAQAEINNIPVWRANVEQLRSIL